MPEMDAPRALFFRPLVKGSEALGPRLKHYLNFSKTLQEMLIFVLKIDFESGLGQSFNWCGLKSM